jgi:hypothetical protein
MGGGVEEGGGAGRRVVRPPSAGRRAGGGGSGSGMYNGGGAYGDDTGAQSVSPVRDAYSGGSAAAWSDIKNSRFKSIDGGSGDGGSTSRTDVDALISPIRSFTHSNSEPLPEEDLMSLTVSREDIASRLNILKTRRGRTGSGRRAFSASASLVGSETSGLGDTTPVAGAPPDLDLRTTTPGWSGSTDEASSLGSGRGERGGGAAARMQRREKLESSRPSQSAPTRTPQGSQGQATMEVGSAAEFPGEQRSAAEGARQIEYTPTEDLRPLDR